MARQGRERANGPYRRERSLKWRVFYFNAVGARSFEDYESHEEAIAKIKAFRQVAGSRTFIEAVSDYLAERVADGSLRISSEVTARHRLTALLRLTDGDRQLFELTPSLARQLYAQRTKEVAPDTHRGELAIASKWAAWCVSRGWLPSNPFESVRPIGQKGSRVDQQLRVSEAQRVLDAAVNENSLESLVVLMALLMGLRAHEVVERTVRDVDANATILWVPKSKTRAGVRQLEIPELLRPALRELCAGKLPTDPVFVRDGKRTVATRHWLLYHVVRIAKLAGVPRVTPHGLRRTWMTLGVLRGSMIESVARRGGHADAGATARRHYLAPGAEETAMSRGITELLTPQVALNAGHG
jgi:integrase